MSASVGTGYVDGFMSCDGSILSPRALAALNFSRRLVEVGVSWSYTCRGSGPGNGLILVVHLYELLKPRGHDVWPLGILARIPPTPFAT